ncbi:unnamed protein product [Symbiodinium sp. CCMP2592]|nr:unnamed protein product [Symbiodinium sp. CCMP2592]
MAWTLLLMTWVLAALHEMRQEMGPCHRGILAIGLQGHRAHGLSTVQIHMTTNHDDQRKTGTKKATETSRAGRRQRGDELAEARDFFINLFRLTGTFLQEWATFEFRATHAYHAGDRAAPSGVVQLLASTPPAVAKHLAKPQDSQLEAFSQWGSQAAQRTEALNGGTWYKGGQSSHDRKEAGMLQEFMAWCETQTKYDAILLLETHWRETSDYRPSFADQAQHIASKRTVTLIGVYQHVHRPQLGAHKNKEIRGQVWHKLQQLVGAIPTRHMMLIAGDFNSTLQPEYPYVGPAAPSRQSHSNYDSAFQALVRDHRLTAANTWHSRPSHTFTAPGVQSQIDYVIVRLQDANRGARYSSPMSGFPVGAHRCTNHLPLHLETSLLPYEFQPQCRHRSACAHNSAALQAAVLSNSAQAQALLDSVERRLQQQPPSPDLCGEHDAVNIILQEETCKFFPPTGRKDCRVSAQPEFRASASTTWELHRRFRRSGLLLVRNIFDRLKHYTAFLRASKALRTQSMALKKQFLQDRQAACQGDQRALFQVARQLAPRSHRGTIRLQDPAGKILGSSAAMEAIVAYGNATFAARPDSIPQLPQQGTLSLGSHTFSTALSKLNVRKAVPVHCAPAASWRLCSSCISDRLGPLLARHFSAGSTAQLVGDLRDAHVVWLEKPGKPPVTVGALRPIGLMPPCAKAIAADLAQQIQAHLQPLLDHMPQYAYSPNRGCSDAILRVHQHFEQVEQLHQSQASNRFNLRSGATRLTCFGGMCLSLDLSKAFDSVCRDKLTESLLDHGVSQDVVGAIQQLHKSARYVFRLEQATGQTITTCGIKQGCRAAPTLWLSLTLSIMETLTQRRSLAWLHRCLTAFADDLCSCWRITSSSDLLRAISDLELILEILAQFRLTVNLQKTALLMNVRGKAARKLLAERTVHKQGEPHLRILVNGQEQFLKICDSHVYLGTKIAYKNRRDLNVAHRISAAQSRYQQIRKVLNGRNPLSTKHRLRLWTACINSSLLYSLEVVGCTLKGLRKLHVLCTRHFRAILKQPAHLSHTTNQAVWSTVGLPTPDSQLEHRMQRFKAAKSPNLSHHGPDIICNDEVQLQMAELLSHHRALSSQLEAERASPQTADLDPEPLLGVVCPHCDRKLPSPHALRIHVGLHHKDVSKAPRPRVAFSATAHAIDGMPTCRLCHRSFTKWRQLKLHIERCSCPHLGGASFILHPPASDNHHMSGTSQNIANERGTAPTDSSDATAQCEKEAYVPLIARPEFYGNLSRWETLLSCRDTKAQLSCRCVLCGMWIATPKHMKQHYNRTHHTSFPDLRDAATALCATFKSQFTRNRSCRYCGTNVGAASRHSVQCTVLHQLCLATIFCQRNLHRQDVGDSGIGDLCSLHAHGATGSKAGRLLSSTGLSAGTASEASEARPEYQVSAWRLVRAKNLYAETLMGSRRPVGREHRPCTNFLCAGARHWEPQVAGAGTDGPRQG